MLKYKYILNTYDFSLKLLLGVLFIFVFTFNSKAQTVNVAATALTTSGDPHPEDGMCPATGRTLQVKVVNNGTLNLNVVTTPVTITLTITGPVAQSFSTILNSGSSISPGGSRYVNVSNVGDFSKKGKYTVQMSATCSGDFSTGIDQTETFYVKGNEINLVSAVSTSNQTVCLNSPLDTIKYQVDANSTTAVASGLPAGTSFTFTYPYLKIFGAPSTNVASPYNYSVTASGLCPISEDSTLFGKININSLPTVVINDKSVDTLTCNVQNITLSASGGVTYSWSEGSNTSSIIISSPTKYIVTGYLATGCSNKDSITIYEDKIPPATPTGSDSSRCGSGKVNLKVSTIAGTTIKWYASDQTTLLGTGLTLTTPTISSTTSFYAEAKNTLTGCLSSKKEIKAIVNTPPVKPTVTPGNRCGKGEVDLSATPGVGESIEWYSTSTGGTILTGGSSSNFTTPEILNTTTYYAQTKNTLTGCISVDRTPVIATINAIPLEPTPVDKSRCGEGTVTLDVVLNGVNQDARWYLTTNPAETYFYNGDSYTTGTVNKDTTLYVDAINQITGCVSSTRVPINVTINSILTPPSATGATRCGPGIVNLEATPIAGQAIDWYSNSTGGSIIYTGNTFTTNEATSKSYFAEARDELTGCLSSSRTEVSVVIIPFNTVSVASSSPTLCINTTLTNITHITTGATGIGDPSDLPSGVSAVWAANKITIS